MRGIWVVSSKRIHKANQALCMRLYEGSNSIKVYDRSMELKSSMIIGLLENIDFILKLSQGDFASIVMLVNSEYDRLKKENIVEKVCPPIPVN
jgi:hypothetical protein